MKKNSVLWGFETVYSEALMNYKMFITVTFCALGLHITTYFFILVFWLDNFETHVMLTMIKGFFFSLFSPDSGIHFNVNSESYVLEAGLVNEYLTKYILPHIKLTQKMIIGAFISLFSYASVPIGLKKFKDISKKYDEKEFIRGAQLIPATELNKKLKPMNPDIPFGTVKLPKEFEIQHVFFIGAPGAGKTVFLSQALERIFKREESCLIYDNKGDFISKFFNKEKDIIFNPLDTRCIGWNVFNEIKTEYDIDAVATSLIPPAAGDSVFWNDAARDVFAGILIYLFQANKKSNRDIWNAVTMDIKRISDILKNTPGAERGYIYIQDGSSKQAVSIHAVLMQYAKSFSYLNIEGDFSITDWIKNPTGNIYVPNYANTKDTLKPILSLFVDLMGRQLLSMPDDINRRIFLMLDEFGSLQRLSTIMNLLTLGRSKGASVWLGIQDIGQLEKIYGKNSRQTIVNACGNCVIFRVSDPTEANYLSEKIGKTVFKIPQDNFSMGVEDMRDGFGITKIEKTEPLVMASEIQSMKNLEAYVKFVGNNFSKISFTYKDYENVNPAFVEDQSYRLEEKYFEAVHRNKKAKKPDTAPEENITQTTVTASGGNGNTKKEKEIDPENKKKEFNRENILAEVKENIVDEKVIHKLEENNFKREEENRDQDAIRQIQEDINIAHEELEK